MSAYVADKIRSMARIPLVAQSKTGDEVSEPALGKFPSPPPPPPPYTGIMVGGYDNPCNIPNPNLRAGFCWFDKLRCLMRPGFALRTLCRRV